MVRISMPVQVVMRGRGRFTNRPYGCAAGDEACHRRGCVALDGIGLGRIACVHDTAGTDAGRDVALAGISGICLGSRVRQCLLLAGPVVCSALNFGF